MDFQFDLPVSSPFLQNMQLLASASPPFAFRSETNADSTTMGPNDLDWYSAGLPEYQSDSVPGPLGSLDLAALSAEFLVEQTNPESLFREMIPSINDQAVLPVSPVNFGNEFVSPPGFHATSSPMNTQRLDPLQSSVSQHDTIDYLHATSLDNPQADILRAAANHEHHKESKHVVIGVILSNGEVRKDQYRCYDSACSGASFARLAELKRHHTTRHGGHAGKKPQFWCPIDTCARSKNGGQEAFPRKDKMMDHLSRVHADKVGRSG
ncbi:uncharacterized protein K460DRAFT_401560 [Cucurbitaria berberidis CBS 394.84]|uniref:C2H2-type domain-containing protein n=1 Tax=Cucurbitaria berberidis CBS 394.84 TaxID=1168544 RepID=A0A9P4GUK1_9PLEO|nr:uncharacterized protein K460DRAFT_401560 [Cucurbitaria berberidis CBS 394.84]KAF1851544.1 hypothetical protein K460DRAFT_401560 [Cucurbitaria berberidis CBS 394.84]